MDIGLDELITVTSYSPTGKCFCTRFSHLSNQLYIQLFSQQLHHICKQFSVGPASCTTGCIM